LSWLYITLVTLWLFLRAIFFDQLWWLALANTFALYLFTPLPLLLLAALLRRRSIVLLALGLPTLAFVTLCGPLLLPKQPALPTHGQTLTTMTFNVLTSNKDSDALVAAIHSARPDILGMQELTTAKRAALQAALGKQMPYHTLDRGQAFGNVGLMSRFPITEVTFVDLPSKQPALHAVLRVGDQHVHVFVAHLSPNHLFKNPAVDLATAASSAFARRAAEIKRLREEMRDLDGPAILLCDCNLTDTSQAHAELRSFLGDSAREAGWGLQFTNYVNGVPFLGQRIDYIWHSAGLVAVAAEVGNPGGSDHRPVVTRLRLSGGQEAVGSNTAFCLLPSASCVRLTRPGSAAPTARAARPACA
jgi:endonuclease/exonuclease/phosphatase (EEP) superfamily protein YafD